MSCYSGPSISTNGLILHLDASNRKSFGGVGQERIGSITPAFNNWGGLVGTSIAYTGKNGKPGVNLTVTTGGGVNYWNSTSGRVACNPSTQYTITALVRYSGNTPHPNLFYVRQYNSSAAQTSESGKYNSANQVYVGDGFYLAWATFTTDATAASFLVHGYEYNTIQLWVEDIQCKQSGMADISGNNNDHSFLGTPTYSYGKYTLDGVDAGFTRLSTIAGASSTCSVVLWYSTTDTKELWVRGSQNNSYYLSAAVGGNYYHGTCGTPTNYVDLATTVRPDSPINYRDGNYHMWEAKGVDFSSWTSYDWFAYPADWHMAGNVSAILVYNRSLSATESAQNFQALRGRFGI